MKKACDLAEVRRVYEKLNKIIIQRKVRKMKKKITFR